VSEFPITHDDEWPVPDSTAMRLFPVSLMVKVALPIAVIVLLRKDGEAFS